MPEALGAGHSSPLAAISIAFWDSEYEIQLGVLTSPFVLVLEMNRSDISTALKSTYSNNGTWAYNGEPISIEAKRNADRRRLQTASDAMLVTCHAYSQGSFGLNELGSVDDARSLSAWASNLLGLIVVLSLLCMTLATVTWSTCTYIRYAASTRDGGERAQSSEYAKSLLLVSYNRVSRTKSIAFKLRTKTQCGSLFCRIQVVMGYKFIVLRPPPPPCL
jgi:hypothetical protein